jgi:hypothetical protein
VGQLSEEILSEFGFVGFMDLLDKKENRNFSIAQLEERYPSKVKVLGSNPSGETGCEKT